MTGVFQRVLGNRVYVFSLGGARRVLEAEISSGWLHLAWEVLWIFYTDYGLVPPRDKVIDGMTSGTFAHVSLTACQRTDPYADAMVHEAAHLLHSNSAANVRGEPAYAPGVLPLAMDHLFSPALLTVGSLGYQYGRVKETMRLYDHEKTAQMLTQAAGFLFDLLRSLLLNKQAGSRG